MKFDLLPLFPAGLHGAVTQSASVSFDAGQDLSVTQRRSNNNVNVSKHQAYKFIFFGGSKHLLPGARPDRDSKTNFVVAKLYVGPTKPKATYIVMIVHCH